MSVLDAALSNAALQSFLRSPAKLSRAAAMSVTLSCALPILRETSANAFTSQTFGYDGLALGGWVMWLVLASFILAALARRRDSLATYSNLFDYAGFGCFGWVILDFIVGQSMSGGGGEVFMGGLIGVLAAAFDPTSTVSIGIGMPFFIAAPIFLYLARRQGQEPIISSSPGRTEGAMTIELNGEVGKEFRGDAFTEDHLKKRF